MIALGGVPVGMPLLVGAVLTAAACVGPAPVIQPPPIRDLIVLTAHPDGAPLGAVSVTTPQGTATISRAGDGVRTTLGAAPSAPTAIPADDIERIFGEALAAVPPPARRFVLHFDSGAERLTAAAEALVPDILAVVRARGRPDVSIVGHTDTTGSARANIDLGMRRAALVRALLEASGLDPDLIEVSSHGEANPAVSTPDNRAEALNRRVDVSVR